MKNIIRSLWLHIKQDKDKKIQRQKLENLGMLAGEFAHDFNNVLAGIQGAAEILDIKLQKNDPLHQYTKLILSTCECCSERVLNLLSFYQKQNESSLLNFHEILEESFMLFQYGKGSELRLSFSLSADTPFVNGKKYLLQSLILNLATNARDAMNNQGEIKISTQNVFLDSKSLKKSLLPSKEGKYIEFCISDQGCGIPKKLIKKIFKPFFTTKEKTQGHGIGLSAVYDIVAQHQGAIFLETSDKGTSFYICLPCCDPVSSVHKDAPIALEQPITILAADDDKILQELLKETLKQLQATPIMAENGQQVLEQFKEHKNNVDLVLTDIMMPPPNGLELYKALRLENPQIKIIFTSGGNIPEDIKNILEKDPLTGFISKPYRLSECCREIKRLIKC